MPAVSGSIDRTSLSLTPLAFGDGSGLSVFVGGLTLGRRKWRRQVVSSVFSPGEVETQAVLDQTGDMTLRFRCRQTSESAVKTQVTDLIAAVEQQTWGFTFSIGGVAWPTVTCTRADSEVIFDTAHVRGFTATVWVYTTRDPLATGPI